MKANLVSNVEYRNIWVDFDNILVVGQKVKDIGDGRRHPSPSLVEEFIESLRAS